VLLTDGWNRGQRRLAIEMFDLEAEDFERRHQHAANTWELGRMSMDAYVDCVVLHRQRPFSPDFFKRFILAQSRPHADIIRNFSALKRRYKLKVVAVSNESRELNDHRIGTFGLGSIIDFFICSCNVHLRKPDAGIFELALEAAHVPEERVIFIDTNPIFCEIAQGLGMRSLVHVERESTSTGLGALGLWSDEADQQQSNCGGSHGA
jgi:putative hydrolase of the HAD superfamily